MTWDVPKLQSFTDSERLVVLSNLFWEEQTPVLIDSAVTDSGSTPTNYIRAGMVLVKNSSTGRYVAADDAAGDRNTAPSVTADEAVGTTWASTTHSFYRNGVLVAQVTLAATDDSYAEYATALNNNAAFAANFSVSDAGGGVPKITAKDTGSDVYIRVVSSLATAYGANGKTARGSWADYRVLIQKVLLEDLDGTAAHKYGMAMMRGHFKESNLLRVTDEAKQVLVARGSRLE
ncbi:MAG: hypothetical protein KatS3mg087_1298 [Patescibacteria group bacterium]|nr:MAG: hypothetical protein KatS3mg087_1298 [Patescibacteria group bacterium]